MNQLFTLLSTINSKKWTFSVSNFSQLQLNEKLLTTLLGIGYETATPIQSKAIPEILAGRDVIASAQTGTGKTAAFMLPALHKLMLADQTPPKSGTPKVLILVPTRELAMQVAKEAQKFTPHSSKIKTVCIYGGIPYPVQKRALSSRFEVLVATPGRLLDQLESGRIDLSFVELLIFDEADRMLDMGFIDDVEKISAATPEKRQTLLFSATIDKKILPFSRKLQKNPFQITIEANLENQNDILQQLYYVDNIDHKIAVLDHLLKNTTISQSIIFTSTKIQTTELAYLLQEKGYHSEAINGDMNQRQRTRTINNLRNGTIQFLVATDVAARGIDISDLSHVINFDLPFQAEDFIHRVGRTGRAGAKGVAITFSTYKEEQKLSRIQDLLLQPMELCSIAGLEARPQESRPRRGAPRGGSGRGAPRNFSRQGNRSERGEGSFAPRGDRPPRSEGGFAPRGDRPPRGEGNFAPRGDRPPRSEGGFAPRGDRPPRAEGSFAPRGDRFESRGRPDRFERRDRPQQSEGFRGSPRSSERSDEPRSSFGAPRGPRFPRAEGSSDSRPPRGAGFGRSSRPSDDSSRPFQGAKRTFAGKKEGTTGSFRTSKFKAHD